MATRPQAALAVLLATVAALSIQPVGGASDSEAGELVTSSDGLISLQFHSAEGAEDVSVTLRPPDELPVEFSSWPNRPPHIDIEPHDRVFDPPVTLTPTVPLEQLGLGPGRDPIPLGVLAIHGPGGGWSCVDDAVLRVDRSEGVLSLTGSIPHAGIVLTFVAGAVDTEPGFLSGIALGEQFVTDTTFTWSGRSAATIEALDGSTGDPAVASEAATFVMPFFGDQVVSHHFDCVGSGGTLVESPAAIADYADDNAFTNALGMAGTSVAVVIATRLECEA